MHMLKRNSVGQCLAMLLKFKKNGGMNMGGSHQSSEWLGDSMTADSPCWQVV